MAAKNQLCDKSLWVRACYNYYLRLSSASFKTFDRLALLGDWQAFQQPPWASLSTTGGRGGGAELIAVIFQSSRYVLFNQARYIYIYIATTIQIFAFNCQLFNLTNSR